MKTFAWFRWLALLTALLTLAGCASRPKVDWSARIGNYTFDQAVLDYGPPTKQAKLTDGTLVAEWQTQRGYTQTEYIPYGGYRYRRWGYYGGTPVTTYYPDAFLRLTFGPDGKLTAWKKVVM